jgi:hypothetical protein
MGSNMRSTGIGIEGDERIDLASRQIMQIFRSDPQFQQVVLEIHAADNYLPADEPCAMLPSHMPSYGRSSWQSQDVPQSAMTSTQIYSLEFPNSMDEGLERMMAITPQDLNRAAHTGLPGTFDFRRDTQLETAVRVSVELGVHHVELVEDRTMDIERWASVLEPLSRHVRERFAPQHILGTPFDHQHSALFAATIDALNLGITNCAERIVLGMPVGGRCPTLGAWDFEYKPASLGMSFDSLPHAQWNTSLVEDLLARANGSERGRANALAILERTVMELDEGLCDGWFSLQMLDSIYGPEGWRATRRNAISQPGDTKGLDWKEMEFSRIRYVKEDRVTSLPLTRQLLRGNRTFTKELMVHWNLTALTTDSYVIDEKSGRTWMPVLPLRCVDDCTESLINASIDTDDKVRVTMPDLPARMAGRYEIQRRMQNRQSRANGSDQLEKSRLQLGHGSDDAKAAFRKALTCAPQYQIVAVYIPHGTRIWGSTAPEGGVIAFARLPGYTFGDAISGTSFNGIMEPVLALMRNVATLVADHCTDDVCLVAFQSVGAREQACMGRIAQCFGWGFKPSKHKALAIRNKFMGVVSDFERMLAEGLVEVYVEEVRKRRIITSCTRMLKYATPKDAERLAGSVQFTLSWMTGRAALSALAPVYVHAQRKHGTTNSFAVPRPLARALNFLRDVIPLIPRRELRLTACRELPMIVASAGHGEFDAACNGDEPPGPDNFGRGGFVILVPSDRTAHGRPEAYVGFGDQADEVLGAFEPLGYKTYVGGYGLLWAASPYFSYPDLFRNRRVLHFLTDGKAVAAVIRGYEKMVGAGMIVNALHARLISLHCDVTFLKIEPQASVATLLASVEYDRVIEAMEALRRAGIHPDDMTCNCLPCMPTLADWQRPMTDWATAP